MWSKKLFIGICTDGAANMTGHCPGVVSKNISHQEMWSATLWSATLWEACDNKCTQN